MHEGPKRLHGASILIVALQQLRSLGGILIAFIILQFVGGKRSEFIVEAILAGIGVLTIIPAVIKYFTIRYELTDEAFTLTSGLLFRQRRIVPLDRIQNVFLKRNILHQLLGVTTLKIETASGSGAEVDLNVVGMAEAERLIHLLQRTAHVPQVETPVKEPIFRASLGDLFLAGATQNRAGVIILFFIGLLNYAHDLLPALAKVLPAVSGKAGLPNSAVVGGMVLLILLLFAGWILSMITSVFVYFGFQLTRSEGVLKLKHGLLTQIQATLPVRRIQSIRIVAPVLQRRLGYCNVYADSAASYADHSAGGAAVLTPLIARERVEDVLHLAFNVDPHGAVFTKVSPLLRRRSFVRYLILGVVFVGAAEAVTGPIAFTFLPATAAAAWYFAWKRFQILGYSRVDGYILVRDGVWKRTISILPEDRIQWIGMHQGPMQRRLGICTLNLVSAAVGGRHAYITDMPYAVALDLQNDLIAGSDQMNSGGL
ncbi:MAG: PH domain-containing protein [Fimbriimonas sp.]